MGSVGLSGDFAPFTKTDYDVEKISSLWTAKHGDFIGTNCRINTYTLLKGKIKIPQVKSDTELLFQDKDAIDKGKLFDAKDQANFDILFQGSRLKLRKMSRFTPSIWRITTNSSPLMTRHACCRLLSTIIWMAIPFLSVTSASWCLRRMATYLLKS
ncbi:Membrane associated protein [Streptococcus sp. HSISS2]|nr:Membrane associated protein [Streptococcus sp. HSISS2]